MYSSLDFQLICEQILLEEDIRGDLIADIKPLVVQALKDYESQKGNPKIDKKLLHSALFQELNDIKAETIKILAQYSVNVNTPEKLDKFIYDKVYSKDKQEQKELEFLLPLRSTYIKEN
jgi:hypothetical protein